MELAVLEKNGGDLLAARITYMFYIVDWIMFLPCWLYFCACVCAF